MSNINKIEGVIYELEERYDGAPDSTSLWMGYAVRDLKEVISVLKIVDGLPKTGDGVPVVPEMELWFMFGGKPMPCRLSNVCGPTMRPSGYGDYYSTEAALLAAYSKADVEAPQDRNLLNSMDEGD